MDRSLLHLVVKRELDHFKAPIQASKAQIAAIEEMEGKTTAQRNH